MQNWYTSDTHFNHFNIIQYCDRPFHTLDEMHKVLIGNWNSLVSKEDTVYFLGDFCFVYAKSGAAKKQTVLKWKDQLNGHIAIWFSIEFASLTKQIFIFALSTPPRLECICNELPESICPNRPSNLQLGLELGGRWGKPLGF